MACFARSANFRTNHIEDIQSGAEEMRLPLRYAAACTAVAALVYGFSLPVVAQKEQKEEYTVKVLPPGGPAPRLSDGHPDLSGHWLPNSAGQGVSNRYGVDPLARRQFDPKVTPEERPVFQPWALEKIKSMRRYGWETRIRL
jgi:hypothetical protein